MLLRFAEALFVADGDAVEDECGVLRVDALLVAEARHVVFHHFLHFRSRKSFALSLRRSRRRELLLLMLYLEVNEDDDAAATVGEREDSVSRSLYSFVLRPFPDVGKGVFPELEVHPPVHWRCPMRGSGIAATTHGSQSICADQSCSLSSSSASLSIQIAAMMVSAGMFFLQRVQTTCVTLSGGGQTEAARQTIMASSLVSQRASGTVPV